MRRKRSAVNLRQTTQHLNLNSGDGCHVDLKVNGSQFTGYAYGTGYYPGSYMPPPLPGPEGSGSPKGSPEGSGSPKGSPEGSGTGSSSQIRSVRSPTAARLILDVPEDARVSEQ